MFFLVGMFLLGVAGAQLFGDGWPWFVRYLRLGSALSCTSINRCQELPTGAEPRISCRAQTIYVLSIFFFLRRCLPPATAAAVYSSARVRFFSAAIEMPTAGTRAAQPFIDRFAV